MGKSKSKTAGETKAQGKPSPRGKEPMEAKKARAAKIVAGLKKLYPDATCELKHDSALQLLIATILSAQSTDETVNKVTPVLFAKYPTAADLAGADAAEVEKVIYQTGFFRQKTKSIMGAARAIAARPGCAVPDTMPELIELPGVARKTANVLLGTWFGKNEGVVVDTHVGRLAHRLKLTWSSKDEKDAVKIEQDLMEVLHRKQWTFTAHALIWHGRKVCIARKPKCQECKLASLCPSAFTFDNAPAGSKNDGKAARVARTTPPRGVK